MPRSLPRVTTTTDTTISASTTHRFVVE
jgi:hypothetical protein